MKLYQSFVIIQFSYSDKVESKLLKDGQHQKEDGEVGHRDGRGRVQD